MRHRGTSLRDKDGIYHDLGSPLKYPSVTSIIDGMEGSDLIFVHNAFTAREVVDMAGKHVNGEMVTMWKPATETGDGWDQPDSFVQVEVPAITALTDPRYIKNIGFRQLRKDADRGSTIHDLISEWCIGSGISFVEIPEWAEMTISETGRTCTVDEVVPYAMSALHWLENIQPKCIHVDCPVFHNGRKGECNDGWGLYAGTLDFIGMVDGRLWLIDFKTSRASRRAHGMQLAAYKHARYLWLQGKNERRPMVRVDGVMSVLIQPDRVTPRDWSSTVDWFSAFRHAIHAYNRLRGNMNVSTLKHLATKTDDSIDKGCPRLSLA